jgi:hypothetical protein
MATTVPFFDHPSSARGFNSWHLPIFLKVKSNLRFCGNVSTD